MGRNISPPRISPRLERIRRAGLRHRAGLDPSKPLHQNIRASWRVTYHFGRTRTGALAVARLEIAPRHETQTVPGDGILSTLLAEVELAEVRRHLRAVIDPPARAVVAGTVAVTLDALTSVATGTVGSVGVKVKRGRGRPQVVKRPEYVRIRDRYLALIDKHDPHPSRTLADEFGIGREAMRSRLHRMRRMGFFDRQVEIVPG